MTDAAKQILKLYNLIKKYHYNLLNKSIYI